MPRRKRSSSSSTMETDAVRTTTTITTRRKEVKTRIMARPAVLVDLIKEESDQDTMPLPAPRAAPKIRQKSRKNKRVDVLDAERAKVAEQRKQISQHRMERCEQNRVAATLAGYNCSLYSLSSMILSPIGYAFERLLRSSAPASYLTLPQCEARPGDERHTDRGIFQVKCPNHGVFHACHQCLSHAHSGRPYEENTGHCPADVDCLAFSEDALHPAELRMTHDWDPLWGRRKGDEKPGAQPRTVHFAAAEDTE